MGTTSAPAARSSSRNSGNGIPFVGGAVQLHRDPQPLDTALDQVVRLLRGRTPIRVTTPRAARPLAARRWPSVPGRRRCALLSASVSSVASPQPSAAAIQPRRPMPVVAITTSGGAAISASVCSRSSSSSGSGTIAMAAALVTVAPRRRSSALSSSARRAEVTATRNPVSGAQSGSAMTPVNAVRVSGRLPGRCRAMSRLRR